MIAIIDYGASNIQSVANALAKLGQKFKVVQNPQELARLETDTDKVILPGVGAAGAAMQRLLETGLTEAIPRLKVPFLGICLGMQLLADFSEEGNVQCLSIIPGKVIVIPNGVKIPQIGWNKVSVRKKCPLTGDIPDESFFYFVNSFYFDAPDEYVIGKTDYGISFPSIVQKNNFYAVQFHPEKSGETGLDLLRNFCEKC